jgi:phospholipid/cholesterol/gamma-HCH transport system substrate-binding protein
MKDERRTEIKVGLTVIIGIIVFLGILLWAKNASLFSNEKTLRIHFDQAAALATGDPVMVNGVRKGRVTEVSAQNDGALVKIALEEDTDLRKDAKFSIMMLDLMGGKKIEIVPGTSPQKLDFSEIQKGKFGGDISTAMAALSSVQTDLIDVIQQIKISLTELNSFLKDEKFKNDVRTAASNLNTLTERLNKIIETNKADIDKIVKSGSALLAKTNALVDSNKENFSALLKESLAAVKSANALTDSLQSFLQETRAGKNNLGKLIEDKKMITNLQDAANKLNELIDILIKQLKNEGINVDANIF